MVGPLIGPVSNGASNSTRVQDAGSKRIGWRKRGKKRNRTEGREDRKKEEKRKKKKIREVGVPG